MIAEAVTSITTREAAELLGITTFSVGRLARTGHLDGVLVGRCGWLFDRDQVIGYAARRRPCRRGARPRQPRLPAEPLLRQIELRGGERALGVRADSPAFWALCEARATKELTVWAADRLAVQVLGLTPLELWGQEYLTA